MNDAIVLAGSMGRVAWNRSLLHTYANDYLFCRLGCDKRRISIDRTQNSDLFPQKILGVFHSSSTPRNDLEIEGSGSENNI